MYVDRAHVYKSGNVHMLQMHPLGPTPFMFNFNSPLFAVVSGRMHEDPSAIIVFATGAPQDAVGNVNSCGPHLRVETVDAGVVQAVMMLNNEELRNKLMQYAEQTR